MKTPTKSVPSGSALIVVLSVIATLAVAVLVSMEYTTTVRHHVQRTEALQTAISIGDGVLDHAFAYWREICEAEKKDVLAAGGLHIVGTERHESRRIDNQLRGRSGRQGDPGSSKFFLALDDDLLRIFGTDRMMAFMEKMGMEDEEPIEHRMITRSIDVFDPSVVTVGRISAGTTTFEFGSLVLIERSSRFLAVVACFLHPFP